VSLLAVLLPTVIVPIVAWLWLLPRSERRHGKLRVVLGTLALGALLFVPYHLGGMLVGRWADLGPRGSGGDAARVAYLFLVAAPLAQGLTVLAIVPVWRSRHFHEAFDGVVYAAAAALGFISAHNAWFLWGKPPGIDTLRAWLAVPAYMFFAASWGYALALDPRKRLGGRAFNVAWLVAMLLNGAYGHIVFQRSATALLATPPVLLCMAGLTWAAARDLGRRGQARRRTRPRRGRVNIAPPSLGAMREALLKSERPVMLTWIAFGALVQAGVMTALLAGAVALGHRLGIDFAAVDRADATGSAAPLVLLAFAALAAFPVSGWLVARASSARTVIEPAMSAALSIIGLLVLLGLAAPVALVFALAFAPIAFGLACTGAWLALR
jgi:RsiW-degrading membrane proteinase PrsW (M82 family)